jgi:hypothetical protein
MSTLVLDLKTINRNSTKRTYTEETVPWHLGVDFTKHFVNPSMISLTHCPVFKELNPEEQLYYNQVHGMGVCENFALLEEVYLVRAIQAILSDKGSGIPKDMADALEFQMVEEVKHSRIFNRLLCMAAPEVYGEDPDKAFSRYRTCMLSKTERALMDMVTYLRRHLVGWVWSALLFEEKNLAYYRNLATCPQDCELDPLFYMVHKLHAIDEVRHIHTGVHTVDLFWETAPWWKRWMNVPLTISALHSSAYPRRTTQRALRILLQKYPRLEPLWPRMQREVEAASRTLSWHKVLYSEKTLSHLFMMLDHYPEMRGMEKYFLCYKPGTHGLRLQHAA